MFDKPTTYRSPKWLQAVRDIGRCVLCGSTEGIQAAHRNKGKGMGIKTDDCATACLCHKCHFEIDNGKDLSKQERHALMDDAIIKTITELAKKGKATV
jgi:hypothetical protein